jgi:hypothetical protein
VCAGLVLLTSQVFRVHTPVAVAAATLAADIPQYVIAGLSAALAACRSPAP